MISVIDEKTLSILNQISLVNYLGFKSANAGLSGTVKKVYGVTRRKFSPSQSFGL
jgi:hypothetical protein